MLWSNQFIFARRIRWWWFGLCLESVCSEKTKVCKGVQSAHLCTERCADCTPLCSHRMLLREDWDSVLECLRAKFENRRWLQSATSAYDYSRYDDKQQDQIIRPWQDPHPRLVEVRKVVQQQLHDDCLQDHESCS